MKTCGKFSAARYVRSLAKHVKNGLFNEVPCCTQDQKGGPHFVGYLPIGLARSALKLDPPFSSGSTTSKTQVRRVGPFPHIVRSNGYATTVSWTDPTTWLCEDPIHSVMAEVRPPLSHLRGVASWPRPPSVGRRPGRGLAARAPWVRARGFSRHVLPWNILRASRHVFSFVTCVCIPHLRLVGRGLVSYYFTRAGGWRGT